MVRLLPSNKESDLFKYQSSLLSQAQSFCNVDGLIDYIAFDEEILWSSSSFYVACNIWKTIEKHTTLAELCQFLGKNETDVIKLLNSYYEYQNHAKITFDDDKVIPNQNGNLLSKKELYKEEGVINDTLKNIIYQLSEIDNEAQDYRHLLLDKRIELNIEKSLNEKDAYSLIDKLIDKLYQIPIKWEEANFIAASQMLIEDWGDKHKGLFEENFPRVFPCMEKILMNVVWKKEKRELMMSVSSQLSEEHLKMIIEYGSEIKDFASKVKDLESENELLKQKLAELGVLDATLGLDSHENGISKEQRIAESNEAKSLVLAHLESKGFDISNVDKSQSTIHGLTKDGIEYPLVVKSCRNYERRLEITPPEWQQLFKPNSMLWLHFGGGVVAPIKAYELFTYQDKLTLSFDTVNIMMDERVGKIMQVMRYFNNVYLNLSTLTPDTRRADNLDEYSFHSNNLAKSDLGEDTSIEF
jgi:hypothetical protein